MSYSQDALSTVHFNEIVFKREKLQAFSRIAKDFIADAGIDVAEDYLHHALLVRLDACIYTNLQDTQTITVYRKRPTFLEWLFRKEIKIEVNIECKELFKNPPKVGDNPFLYVAKQL